VSAVADTEPRPLRAGHNDCSRDREAVTASEACSEDEIASESEFESHASFDWYSTYSSERHDRISWRFVSVLGSGVFVSAVVASVRCGLVRLWQIQVEACCL
jgi:hypothetical protein